MKNKSNTLTLGDLLSILVKIPCLHSHALQIELQENQAEYSASSVDVFESISFVKLLDFEFISLW